MSLPKRWRQFCSCSQYLIVISGLGRKRGFKQGQIMHPDVYIIENGVPKFNRESTDQQKEKPFCIDPNGIMAKNLEWAVKALAGPRGEWCRSCPGRPDCQNPSPDQESTYHP